MTIVELEFNSITILTVSWVWYEIWINEAIYQRLSLEEQTELFVYHHKTENSESLFWFLEKSDKKIFSELIKISWIWGKVAMQILSMWTNNLLSAIKMWDNKAIESIKWVWKKMAEKIILEFKDKDFLGDFVWERQEKLPSFIDENLFISIRSTLTNMGYNPKDVENILRNLPEDLTDAWSIIPFVIKNIS